MDSCHANPSPSDPMESVSRYFRPPPQLYFAEYVLSLLRTDMRWSDGFLPRQPVSIGSDGVRLPTFSTPSSAILCELSSGESGCSWPSSIGLSLGVLDNPPNRLLQKRLSDEYQVALENPLE